MKSQKHDDNTTRIAVLETTVSHIHETLERMEKHMDKGFSEINSKIDKINSRVDKMNDRLWSIFLWLLGIMISGFIGSTGFVAHAMHWI